MSASTEPARRSIGSRLLHVLVAFSLVTSMVTVLTVTAAGVAQAATPCDAPVTNKVACENTKPGTADWQAEAPDEAIAGFTTDISSTAGGRVDFKINTNAASYRVDIYRLGYYGGAGARQLGTLNRTTPQTQPACLRNDTGLADCGNWAVSLSWNVPTDAVSGLYYAKLHRNDTGAENEIAFVLRDDASTSKILYQTSDSTWQAYNRYGGASLYVGDGPGKDGSSFKVSYNRPMADYGDENFIFNAELPTLRFLERQGYDMSYTTNIDTARRGNLIKNHKVFMAVGHDEYWSNEMRANVESARDAGVNLAFLTGNEIFWKTRYEPSIDGSATDWRTVVCYKETKSPQVDPNPTVWTGTWRDPRYSPPKDGGRPENSLLGQIFTVNGRRDDSMQVPAAYGKMRLWRNTAVANQTTGATYTFRPGTLGYEWDTVEDNGFQPPGVAQLSRTTLDVPSPFVLKNYGDLYLSGTKTHALTLYRASSGALVFGAGTVQWAWGLDDDHAFATNTPTSDPAIQQATINLLADMGVQPSTLQAGLTAATASADTAAPTVTISAPATAAAVGQPSTINGTVNDATGKVAGVEVSSDSGATWHPATWVGGSTTWTYTYTPASSGPVSLRARAVDDSANLSAPVSVSSTIAAANCPCSIWNASATPADDNTDDTSAVELGVKWRSSAAGYVRGVRFHKGPNNTGTHTGSLWTSAGVLLATGTFTNETATGWQTMSFPSAVAVAANTTYVVSYYAPAGRYSADVDYFKVGSASQEPLTALQSSTADGANGVFKGGPSGFPSLSARDTNYWVDVVWATDPGPDTRAPALVSTAPVNAAGTVPLSGPITAAFDEPIAASSVQFTVTSSAGAAAGTSGVSADGKTVSFTPSSPLAGGTVYTARIAATDVAGNALNPAVTWTFTTGTPRPAACPCTVWDDFTRPAVESADDKGAIELGSKVRFDGKGEILGVRFFKGAANTGTHTGSLWSASGQLLATGTFSGESASGWQTLTFASPVQVVANTTYVVSYYAPVGGYSANSGFFGASADYGSIHMLQNGVDGGNGVYRSGAGGGFPTASFGSTNYWVDVIYRNGLNGDTTPPTITASGPAANAADVPLAAPLTATFSEPVDLSSAQVSLADPGGAKIAGNATLSADKLTLTWTPTGPLAPGTAYAASIKIADDNGIAMPAPLTYSFTTTTTASCPCSLFSVATTPTYVTEPDPGTQELGVRFVPSSSGKIAGVRFYKGPQNTGVHTASLWTSTGQQVATGTFTNETATGWQTLIFANPVTVLAGTTYIASYSTTTGYYSADPGYFLQTGVNSPPLTSPRSTPDTPNGVYRAGSSGFPTQSYQGGNYWVDVVYTPSTDTTSPTVTSRTPAADASGVPITSPVSVTFSEPVDVPSAQVTVLDPGGARLKGTVTASADKTTLTWTPVARFGAGTRYAVTVRATDVNGNALAAPATWSFTTATTRVCPCTLFSAATIPTVESADEPGAIELGVRFSSTTAGTITGVRFYKGTRNTGTHTGSLWSDTGQLLATGTYSNESATGWQTLTFATPVAVTPGTTYVASYTTTVGYYSVDGGYFQTTGVANPPLAAAQTSATTPNGVFTVGSGFPTTTYAGGNYWVDAVFTDGPTTGGDVVESGGPPPTTDSTPPAVTGRVPAPAATEVSPTAAPSATFNEPITQASAQFTVTGPGGAAVAGTVAVSADQLTLTFTPSAVLATGAAYTVSVRASDVAGNAMTAPDTWSFTTGSPPAVAARAPAANSSEASTTSPMSASFTRPVALTGSTFTLADAGGAPVVGVVGLTADQLALTFTPASALAAGTRYTASVRAVNARGTLMPTADTWSFTTAAPPTVTARTPAAGAAGVALTDPVRATFSEPVNPTSVQFSVADPGGATLTGAVAVSPDGLTATWTPASRLAASTRYSASVRASDAAGNPMAAPDTWSFTGVGTQTCPCTLYSQATVPTTSSSGTAASTELGVRFTPTTSGSITGVRFYKAATNTGTHTGSLWTAAGSRLATGTFSGETASGWQNLTFGSPVAVVAGTTYVASYTTTTTYSSDAGYFVRTGVTSPPLSAPGGGANLNGVSRAGPGFPTTLTGTNFWVDAVYNDLTPPAVTARTPAANATAVALTSPVSATFTEPVNAATAQFTLADPGGARIAGTVTQSADRLTLTFTPGARLNAATRYTASVRAADSGGNTMAAADTWSFTAATTQVCPCTLFSQATVPTEFVAAGQFIEAGVKFTASTAGMVTGVRFYKGTANTGTHTGSLWSGSGTRLATGTFTAESASGWQTLAFPSSVLIAAGSTYVVSYTSPTGNYSRDSGYFGRTAVTSPPLASPSSNFFNPNGVWRLGSAGNPNAAATNNSNLWVEPVFVDNVPPTVSTRTPAANATNVSLTSAVSARFSEPVDAATAQFAVADPGGAKLAGTVTQSADRLTLTFTPSARFAAGTRYTATVLAADPTGLAMAAADAWSFTATTTQTCPCSLFSTATVPTTLNSGDVQSLELGVRFTTSRTGNVTGVRFYKGTTNTGRHTASLWSSTGTRLATGTFSGESASGWQTLTFATPVPVTAGTTYVASYTTTTGYSLDSGYYSRTAVTSTPLSAASAGNAVYRSGPGFPNATVGGNNFWVDVTYQ